MVVNVMTVKDLQSGAEFCVRSTHWNPIATYGMNSWKIHDVLGGSTNYTITDMLLEDGCAS